MTSVGSKLPRGVTLVGSIRGQGDLRIAGEVEGPIEIDGLLVIEPSGVVRGEIRARSITVAGQLEGNATAVELVRLEPGAKMVGDARAERVSAAAGALLRGRIRTSQERAQLERMRRTTGGTLLAPYSSSGMLAAPGTSPGVVRAPSSAGSVASVVREDAPAPRRRDTEPLPPLADVVRDELGVDPVRVRSEEIAPEPAENEAPASQASDAEDRPPPPVMPSLGRRRASRRNVEASS